MAWVYFVVLASVAVAALSSLWWADHPLRSGAVLMCVTVLCSFGVAKQAAWGVSDVQREADQWCLTYDHPDGTSFIECRPSEAKAWAWAADLDAELEREYGPLEQTTTAGAAYTVLFYASLLGAIASVGWAAIRCRRSHRLHSPEPSPT